eukprot:TRINITY_DN11191_c2_g5_i1.p1 TRINITY_DN11191_c2_g5~~TRINITY_DN11191_c2_g5_i1.p1  ORF type:complete len:422 (+),score=87.13 TRINITY_DN11191_c2_g5_i1:144-1409(+)
MMLPRCWRNGLVLLNKNTNTDGSKYTSFFVGKERKKYNNIIEEGNKNKFSKMNNTLSMSISGSNGDNFDRFKIEVIEEDEDYLFLNKQSNVSLSRDENGKNEKKKNIYLNQIQDYLKINHKPTIVHGLAKEESGIIVVSKNESATKYFQDLKKKQNNVYQLSKEQFKKKTESKVKYTEFLKTKNYSKEQKKKLMDSFLQKERAREMQKTKINSTYVGITTSMVPERCLNSNFFKKPFVSKPTGTIRGGLIYNNKAKGSYTKYKFIKGKKGIQVNIDFTVLDTYPLHDLIANSGTGMTNERTSFHVDELSLVCFNPKTFEKHQLRAVSDCGNNPILNDIMYRGIKYAKILNLIKRKVTTNYSNNQFSNSIFLHHGYLSFVSRTGHTYSLKALPFSSWNHLLLPNNDNSSFWEPAVEEYFSNI